MYTKSIGQVLLRFESGSGGTVVREQLSGVVLDPEANLWLAVDEDAGVSRLQECREGGFCMHRHFDLADAFFLPDGGEEIDIEGMVFQNCA